MVALTLRCRSSWANQLRKSLLQVVEWYFLEVYGRLEGPNIVPYYCDPKRVGHFAVSPAELANQGERALFRLFVAMAMFQARRDVIIMRQQRAMSRRSASTISSMAALTRQVRLNACPRLVSPEAFDLGCSVSKSGETGDCSERPGTPCHVKDATELFRRMGDMGKLPTSAWLHVWKRGLGGLLDEVLSKEPQPTKRAGLLVDRFARIHRVGRKLATMFVSALSTPALAPGLTPWFPAVDGNALVVVDTHVARVIDLLRKPDEAKTYDARANWLRQQASTIDLRQFRGDVPSFSPRLVQQAIYAFGSKSNRVSRGDKCARGSTPCDGCVPSLCPFVIAAG